MNGNFIGALKDSFGSFLGTTFSTVRPYLPIIILVVVGVAVLMIVLKYLTTQVKL